MITQGHFAIAPDGRVELTLRHGREAQTFELEDKGALLAFLARAFAAPVRPNPTTPPSGTPEIEARAA